ncbi:cyclophilin-like fold protein [Haloplanus salilacus]|uniref:cyclophilin-like fold protein n=1 Tax=Haloplanus salilacus TaxID=2949994 RepID=UPI0030CC79BD
MSDSEFTVAVDGTEVTATWLEESPETRRAIADALPLSGEATRWGDELYFRIPVDVDAEEPRATVEPGTIAYWPRGSALCLFWGPTPASTGSELTAASPVNVVAQLEDLSPLTSLPDGAGATVRLSE